MQYFSSLLGKMVDTTKAVERKKKNAEAKKKALKAAQEGKEKEDKAYRDKVSRRIRNMESRIISNLSICTFV